MTMSKRTAIRKARAHEDAPDLCYKHSGEYHVTQRGREIVSGDYWQCAQAYRDAMIQLAEDIRRGEPIGTNWCSVSIRGYTSYDDYYHSA